MCKEQLYANIKTERLFLRPFKLEDAEAASYNSKQPSVAYAMSDMVLSDSEEAKNWIKQTHSWFNITGRICQILAVERNVDHKVLGLVGIAYKDNLNGEVEILYGIADEYQNNGYATEAGEAIINWAFNNCQLNYLVAIVKLDNYASQRVIDKLGFQYIKQLELEYDGNLTQFMYYRLYCR